MRFATITANDVGRIRRATLNGREHLVASATLIVPGVLAGSRGPMLYETSDIADSYKDWEGKPVTIYHPSDAAGNPLSAGDRGVLAKQGVGTVRNVRIDSNGALRGEMWFDLQRLRRIDNRVYDLLVRGQKIELSTGLYTRNEPAVPGASYGGKPYELVARDFVPDHVAVLPDMEGACSVRDGCGVLNRVPDRKKKIGCKCKPVTETLNDDEDEEDEPTYGPSPVGNFYPGGFMGVPTLNVSDLVFDDVLVAPGLSDFTANRDGSITDARPDRGRGSSSGSHYFGAGSESEYSLDPLQPSPQNRPYRRVRRSTDALELPGSYDATGTGDDFVDVDALPTRGAGTQYRTQMEQDERSRESRTDVIGMSQDQVDRENFSRLQLDPADERWRRAGLGGTPML